MKITGFCPMIVTKDPESVMKVFEDLGFERRHTKTDIYILAVSQHIKDHD